MPIAGRRTDFEVVNMGAGRSGKPHEIKRFEIADLPLFDLRSIGHDVLRREYASGRILR